MLFYSTAAETNSMTIINVLKTKLSLRGIDHCAHNM